MFTAPGDRAGRSGVRNGGQVLRRGFTARPFDNGIKATGSFTPNPRRGNYQCATNGGAHSLLPPARPCDVKIEYVNNASAGTVTTSSFTKVTGDTITTTNGHKFFFFVSKHRTYSHLHVQALQ